VPKPTFVVPKSESKSLSTLESKSQPALESKSLPASESPGFFVPLMQICKLATPLVKRVPQNEASQFATLWGKLLDVALFTRSESAWSDFFAFPKCILWSPIRGGRKLSKKASATSPFACVACAEGGAVEGGC